MGCDGIGSVRENGPLIPHPRDVSLAQGQGFWGVWIGNLDAFVHHSQPETFLGWPRRDCSHSFIQSTARSHKLAAAGEEEEAAAAAAEPTSHTHHHFCLLRHRTT